ncbi:alpha/beta hydrolase family protein [Leptospira inadai serovar Lyme str. 10]|uniref:Alpha/beta hydrolase family protein n=2 Tax=Leptospira inadai serovar Lyme TaxID=293084 RepID=V6H8N3_9LEPT|nr:alpha/beta hydrolase [Leptospira inadai]EQA35132.1 alpha/beta hydrolase family protein [Leptospira inadai serovar Lyme str. 10]PNV75890.1 alpha/beta hydrolase [Leptospira inadai serovar Lyme]
MKKKVFLFASVLVLLALASAPYLRSVETEELTSEIRSKVEGKFVRLSKGLTHYRISGSENGKLVVLVHGFTTPYFIWDSTTDALERAGYRVLRFDLYGRGYSDRPNTIYDIPLFQTQLEELLSALKISDPFDIIGLSMGGPICASFVSKNSERVRKVVLIDPFSEKAKIFPLNLRGIGEYVSASIFIPALPERLTGDFFNPERIPEGWKKKYQEQMKFKGFGSAILSTLRNLLSIDPKPVYERLAETKKPVLLIWGEEDRTTPLATGSYVKELLKPTFLLVPKSGHLPHIERPEIVFPELISFLSK